MFTSKLNVNFLDCSKLSLQAPSCLHTNASKTPSSEWVQSTRLFSFRPLTVLSVGATLVMSFLPRTCFLTSHSLHSDYNHPDLAAVNVFIQYMTQLEGPMWRHIRGMGLSYHYRYHSGSQQIMIFYHVGKLTRY